MQSQGFYMIGSKDFDKRIRIYHSHKPALKIKLSRNVEEGHIQFFDLRETTE
jgi:hypothetical protein